MNGPPLETLRELFEKASELAPSERASFLSAHCADPATRARVQSLLESHESAREFLSTPAADLTQLRTFAEESPAGEHDPLEGATLGRYRIVTRLGSGGMGIVYQATQDNPRRTVALKVIRGMFTGPELLRRFRHEAEALGRLKHPGIAQIFEAGAAPGPDGRELPFIAMELITGRSLLEFCNDANLPVRDRLELFARVCDAVSHAHQKGVIHRDLKPANILVEKEETAPHPTEKTPAPGGSTRSQFLQPTPKILDFGVARLTDSEAATMRTDAGQVVGTLAYMSPEQVRGDADRLDTRSDVYALGVILYELLTGHLPYAIRGKPIAEAARVIADLDPTLPGSHLRTLRGDVETIVMKALEKESDRRYQSAADLAADIRRHLQDMPIVARPATTVYQLRKFARRNRVLVGGMIAVAVTLLIGMAGTLVGWVRASRAQAETALKAAEASKEAERSGRTLEFVRRVLAASDLRNTGGKDFTMKDLLAELAARAKTELADDPKIAAAIYDTIALSYAANSDLDRASEYAAFSERLRLEHLGQDSIDYAQSMITRGMLARDATNSTTAQQDFRLAIDILEKQGPPAARDLAFAMGALAETLAASNNPGEAEQLIRHAIELLGDSKEHSIPRIDMHSILADVLWVSGQAARAEEVMRDNIVRAVEFYGEEHPKTAFARMALARTLQHGGKKAEAIEHFRSARSIFERVYPPGHRHRIVSRQSLAFALLNDRQLDEADQIVREDIRSLEASVPLDQSQLARVVATAATIANSRRDFASEEPLRRRHMELVRQVHGQRTPVARLSVIALAQCLLNIGKVNDAGDILAPLIQPDLDSDVNSTRLEELLMVARWLDAAGKAGEAESTYRRVIRLSEENGISPSMRLSVSRRFAAWLVGHRRIEEAAELMDSLHSELVRLLGDQNQFTLAAAKEATAIRQRLNPTSAPK